LPIVPLRLLRLVGKWLAYDGKAPV